MAKGVRWTALFVSAFVFVPVLAVAGEEPWIEGREVVFKGSFFEAGVEDELVVRHGWHHIEVRWGDSPVWSVGFPSYVSEIGTCRDLESGLDRLFFTTASGGSDGAMQLSFLGPGPDGTLRVVFKDGTASPELGRYFRHSAHDSDSLRLEETRLEDLDGLVCAAGDYMARRERGQQIRRALAPSARPVALAVGERVEVVSQTLPSRVMDPARVATLLAMHDNLGEGFARGTLAETDRWRVEIVAFYHFYSSWGLVLLENKQDGGWRSIYEVPTGSSKNYLLEPAIEGLDLDSARVDFCPVCTNWPTGPHPVLDLGTLRLEPSK